MWNKIKSYIKYLIAIILGIFLFYLYKEHFTKITEIKNKIKEKEEKIANIDNKITELDKQDLEYQEKINNLQHQKEEIEVEIDKISNTIDNIPDSPDIANINDAIQYVLNQLR